MAELPESLAALGKTARYPQARTVEQLLAPRFFLLLDVAAADAVAQSVWQLVVAGAVVVDLHKVQSEQHQAALAAIRTAQQLILLHLGQVEAVEVRALAHREQNIEGLEEEELRLHRQRERAEVRYSEVPEEGKEHALMLHRL